MAFMVFLFFLGLVVFGVGIWTLCKNESLGYIFVVIGTFFIAGDSFLIVPREIPSGLPMTGIDKGEYKAAFVYVAGENVNVGIEKKDGLENDHERLYLYQFSKSAFDGSINTNAKKLVVVESGSFRKLVLK